MSLPSCSHLLILLAKAGLEVLSSSQLLGRLARRVGRAGRARWRRGGLLATVKQLLAHSAARTVPAARRAATSGVVLSGRHLACGPGSKRTNRRVKALVAVSRGLDDSKDGLAVDVAEALRVVDVERLCEVLEVQASVFALERGDDQIGRLEEA